RSPSSALASGMASGWSRSASRNSTPVRRCGRSSSLDADPQQRANGAAGMKRFNLSEWAITHQALVLFTILVLGAAGIYSYLQLGRAEDPSFTIKTMVINVAWPGATATEMQ